MADIKQLNVNGTVYDIKDEVARRIIPAHAEVGQTIVVSEVDENGNPSGWEAVNFPDGGNSGVGRPKSEVITEFTIEESVNSVYTAFNWSKYRAVYAILTAVTSRSFQTGVSTGDDRNWFTTPTLNYKYNYYFIEPFDAVTRITIYSGTKETSCGDQKALLIAPGSGALTGLKIYNGSNFEAGDTVKIVGVM